jgi:hypothetical protein
VVKASWHVSDTKRRTISARTLLIIMPITALLAWGGLLLFTRYIPPQSAPALLAFFVLLSLALFCTLTLLIYPITRVIQAGRSKRPELGQAMRQSGLISIWIIFNLLLRVLASWSLFTAIVSFGIIMVIEILAMVGR